MKKFLIHILLFSLLWGCSESSDTPIEDTIDGVVSDSSVIKEKEFIRLQDSILKNYSSAIKLINQIDNELSKISNVSQTNESYNLETEILQKIDYLSFQLKSRNEDINKLELKIKSLANENKEFLERIQNIESILAEKDVIIANQNARISLLENELSQTRTERDFALAEKQNIEQFANETVMQKNTAFYIIGKESKLEKDNIIKMEGEGFLGIGGKYIPSPDLDLKHFTKIDITKDTLLPIMSNVKVAEIVSSHSRRLLEVQSSPSGTDYLKVRNPELFWKTDKLLIIIIEDK